MTSSSNKEEIQVLSALDRARTQWYHFTAIIIAGMGFFTDAYDLFCISTVTKLLGRIYYYNAALNQPGRLPTNVAAAVNGVALFGTLAGQLFFGWLGDKMGRKKVYGITLLLMIFCSVASGLSLGRTATGVMATLCFFRFWLGFGIGGDYPLSATIMSEYANKKTRGAFIAAVFAMQGFGILAGAGAAIVTASAFNRAYPRPTFAEAGVASTPEQADLVWRIILMAGSIPAALTYYWRMKMPETARYTVLVAGNAARAAEDMAKVLSVEVCTEQDKIDKLFSDRNSYGLWSMEFVKRHGAHLLGTTTTWFLLDVAFYSQNLFQKDVFVAVKWLPAAESMSGLEEVFKIARTQALIALCSTVPGYWFTVAFIDRVGRFPIQLLGFLMMTAFMFSLSIPYNELRGVDCGEGRLCGGSPITFVVLFGFTFFFANFGPNATTFIIPAELFPARLRSTCHGISAAAGKAGAIVGAFGFLYTEERGGGGTKRALILLACTNALGFFFTLLLPETNGRSLEDLSGENKDLNSRPVPAPDPSLVATSSVTRSQNNKTSSSAPLILNCG